jgi:hypothetical protein
MPYTINQYSTSKTNVGQDTMHTLPYILCPILHSTRFFSPLRQKHGLDSSPGATNLYPINYHLESSYFSERKQKGPYHFCYQFVLHWFLLVHFVTNHFCLQRPFHHILMPIHIVSLIGCYKFLQSPPLWIVMLLLLPLPNGPPNRPTQNFHQIPFWMIFLPSHQWTTLPTVPSLQNPPLSG